MSAVEISEAFLAKIAGWEAMKRARAYLEQGAVLSSNWTPPLLKGVVQDGTLSYRAGLVIKDTINLENICRCRASQDWGTICAHSVAVGLHHLRRGQASEQPPATALRHAASLAENDAASAPTLRRSGRRVMRAESGEAGELAEVSVIVPPNFASSIARGKVMACFEAKWSRGRTPLNALPLQTRFRFGPEDLKLLDRVEELADGETPGMLMLAASDFARLLGALIGHPRVTLGRADPLSIRSKPWRVPLQAVLEPTGEIELRVRPGAERPLLIPGKPSWVYRSSGFEPTGLPLSCESVLHGPVRFERAQVPIFLSRDWPVLQQVSELEANFHLDDFVLEPQAPRFILELRGGLAQLQAQLQCAYGRRIMTVGVTSRDEQLWLPDPAAPSRYSTRDLAAEHAAQSELRRAGFLGPDTQGQYQLTGQNAVLSFFARLYPRLKQTWEVTLEERLERSTSEKLEWIEPQFQVTPSGEQWFDLDVSFAAASGERFSAAEMQRLVLSGQSHARLKSGKLALIDTGAVEELQEVLLDCAPQQQGGGYRLRNNQAGFLDATLRRELGWQLEAPNQWRERAARQSGEARLELPPLEELDPVLRGYQKQGVAWLWFLRENQFGGILADEMGLGKTLQALAYLQVAARKKKAGRDSDGSTVPRPSLVICPTSLVFNWEAEAKRFTPELSVLAVSGPQRSALFELIPHSDLVITSYALMRRDADLYKGLEFDTVILDEAQHIKNRQTQNAQAVKAVRAQHRVVLTGTPLENSVLDLWSIFDFLMPGYLGSASDFRERYELPIARERNSDAQARLARRVRPFLLRRLKRDVATDLPERIEQVSYCDMTEDQRAAYQQILEISRREVLEQAGAQGSGKSRMAVLNALLRLRQICCDLRLLKLEGVDPAQASGKLDLFGELLEQVLDGGHRVLVFSQFVQMLALLRERLNSEGIAFSYLDGSTTNRAEVVQEFQSNASIPVFLISLKAGGVGLNLTGADTVIHFDPWWNPAVEAQATDRAHRIGQTRVVTSYKLITRGTVEEKILNLQARKRELLSEVLSGEEALANALTWEEIQELLN
ncbi:MAG: SNF2-related protein [Verrucomicrobiia bacterium]